MKYSKVIYRCLATLAVLAALISAIGCSSDSSSSGGKPKGVWYVNVNATGTGDGKSWKNAFTTVQEAVDAAKEGEEIWVAKGTYLSPNSSDPTVPVVSMKKKVSIYGGFNGTESDRSQRDYVNNVTILSGGYSALHVVLGADSASLDGFTITEGRALDGSVNYGRLGGGMLNYEVSPTVANCIFTMNTAGSGGAMHNYHFNGEIVDCEFYLNSSVDSTSTAHGGGAIKFSYCRVGSVANCSFTSNTAKFYGGAIFSENSGISIENCAFSGDRAISRQGGAIYINGYGQYYPPYARVQGCLIQDCRSGDWGGGISVFSSNSTISDCVFKKNQAASGGGLCSYSSNSAVENCDFVENSASYRGGAIFNEKYSAPPSTPLIKNCLIRSNTSAQLGGGIANSLSNATVLLCTLAGNAATVRGGGISNENCSPSISNCIIWSNSAPNNPGLYSDGSSSPSVTYCDVQGGYAGTGNINLDPIWTTGPYGDYYLSQTASGQAITSPCVDAGSAGSETFGMNSRTTKTNGDPDLGTVDMGYHYRR